MESTLFVLASTLAQEPAQGAAQALGPIGGALGIMAVLFVWLALKTAFVGATVWFAAAYPDAAQRIFDTYETRRLRCFVVGLVNVIVGVLLALLLIATKVLAVLGILLLLALAIMAVVGFYAPYYSVGLRVLAQSPTPSRVRTIVAGGLVAEVTFLLPLIGQLLSLVILFRSFGAVTHVLLARRGAPKTEPVATPPLSPPAL